MTSDTRKTHLIEKTGNYCTPKGRADFVALAKRFRRKDAAPDDKGAFALSLLFPPEVDLKPLIKAANEKGRELFGKDFDGTDPKKLKKRKWPFKDAVMENITILDKDGEETDLEGWTVVRFSTYTAQPVLRDGTVPGNPIVDRDDYQVECYSGRWFRVMCKPHAYDVAGGSGVKFYLESVQLLKHDEPTSSFGRSDDGEGFGAADADDDEAI